MDNCCYKNPNGTYDPIKMSPEQMTAKIKKIRNIKYENLSFYEKLHSNACDLFFYIHDNEKFEDSVNLCNTFNNWFLLVNKHKIETKCLKSEKVLFLDNKYLITKDPQKCEKCLIFSVKY